MYEYAGQIFCEMLGQTCYPEFYENNQTEYQEVFPHLPFHNILKVCDRHSLFMAVTLQ
jgi:hypothetical protein